MCVIVMTSIDDMFDRWYDMYDRWYDMDDRHYKYDVGDEGISLAC